MAARSGIVGLVALGLASAGAQGAQAQAPQLHAMFQDHAVLQRGAPIRLSGQAAPNERLDVQLGRARVAASADGRGRWTATLPPMQTGGPHTLVVRNRGGEARTISDILIGDVYLCAGQSNMELPVAATLNSGREIARATDGSIRLLTIAHASNPLPLDEFQSAVSWSPVSPETVRDFSATCYYFARELKKSVDVPMGLIDASWGGSSVEAWTGAAGLRGDFDAELELLSLYARDRDAALQRFAAGWESWWRTRAPAHGEPWKERASSRAWRAVPEPMRDWKTWGVSALAAHNGMVWFRRDLTVTPAQAAQAATLDLGGIDEVDTTWVNGRAIGNTFGWSAPRSYALPAGALRAGENSIVVNVLSTWDAGGMYGPARAMTLKFADGSSIPLGERWRYRSAAPEIGYPPRAPWESIGGLSTLYNAMIAPIGAFGLRGVVWYQGESNTGAPEQYEKRLAGFMTSLRAQFGSRTPFLIVQLPNFGAPVPAPTASGWAGVRDAQRRAVAADAHAALAVTIDVGDRMELHPPNKQAVGARLARAARALIYGESVTPSGPRPRSAERRDDGRVSIAFADVEGELIAYSGADAIGFELCGPEQSSCRFVRGQLQGDSVILDARAQNLARVRYCWGDAPICNLYDGSGLPAGPFEMEVGSQ
jgi:sialate O-acetylesterase